MKKILSLILFLGAMLPAWAQSEFLDITEAFRPSVVRLDTRTLELRFDIAPGHYLYRNKLALLTPGLTASLPAGHIKQDPAFGAVETYSQSIRIPLSAHTNWPDTAKVTFTYQGCADAGLCYPPQTLTLLPGVSSATARSSTWHQRLGPAITGRTTDQPITVQRPLLFAGGFAGTLGLFFLAGIGLAFTACMYPLIPIVSGIVLGGASLGRGRAFGLAVTYVQGMALSYTLAGILAAAGGAFLAVALQQPWVIGSFALFFVVMALAMFGLFELQLPVTIQTRFNQWANLLPGGRFVPVFLMGALSALIVGPCMAPPLAAALAYLGRSGDLLLGGAALYALASGMGLPLIAIGVFGATALPRLSPRVLQAVKMAFGLILLAMAIWVARPLWYSRVDISGLNFHSVQSVSDLEKALSARQGQAAIVDFYADWCVSCLEFERETLSDPGIQEKLQPFTLLRADVTANTPDQRALMAHYGVFGPPTLLFFDRNGKLHETRLAGKPSREEFIEALRQANP